MPLTADQKKKLNPTFVRTLTATGEAIIAAQIPVSMAYALRDGVAFEAWPDDAIEATARLSREILRRLEALAQNPPDPLEPAPAQPAAPDPGEGKTLTDLTARPPTGTDRAPKRPSPQGHKGRHGRHRQETVAPPTGKPADEPAA